MLKKLFVLIIFFVNLTQFDCVASTRQDLSSSQCWNVNAEVLISDFQESQKIDVFTQVGLGEVAKLLNVDRYDVAHQLKLFQEGLLVGKFQQKYDLGLLDIFLLMNYLKSIQYGLNMKLKYGNRTIETPVFTARYQQSSLAKFMFRYGNINSNSNILEIGYGTPSILLAVRSLVRGNIVGLDVSPSPLSRKSQKQFGLHLIEGNVPSNQDALALLNRYGKYQVIVAGDVFKSKITIGEPFLPQKGQTSYLRFLKDMLTESGVLIVQNDGLVPIIFDRRDVLESGLEIEQWARIRYLSPEIRQKFAREDGHQKNFGYMVTYVIRNSK